MAAVAVVVLGVLAAAAFVWSGAYDIGADDPHLRLTTSTLQTLRMRSIAVRARQIEVPDLQDPARIRRGAGNYDAMCAGCHLAPGAGPSELSQGLYPAPPNLSRLADIDAAQAFWVIKHGIKASGMPAWGKSMEDSDIWDLVAFLERLPALNSAQYEAEVAASGGHSHGGGETPSHEHAVSKASTQDSTMSNMPAEHHHAGSHSHAHDGTTRTRSADPPRR